MNRYHQMAVWIVALSACIMLANLHAPANGYHNWKTTHYFQQAKSVANGDIDGIMPVSYWDESNNYTGLMRDTLPLYPWMVGLYIKTFGGTELAMARSIDILFGLIAMLGFYFFMRQATGDERLATLSLFFFALFPVTMYFCQNCQVVSGSMAFMLWGQPLRIGEHNGP